MYFKIVDFIMKISAQIWTFQTTTHVLSRAGLCQAADPGFITGKTSKKKSQSQFIILYFF